MMRSLWSGVSGLQSHQIAMDVEGDNIANVNTVGFKYSRANFADIFSQTSKPATAPENELGGKNAMQVGLGTQIISTQKIFKQGSLQTTDNNTDLAIQGNGFFIVSPDGGLTRYYTRNGAFVRDVLGNFVDSNGYIVQGWMRDEDTNTIDPTVPVTNIRIDPGLSMPANATKEISFKGNLNVGQNVGTQSSAIYSLDSNHGWIDRNNDGVIAPNEVLDENDLGYNEIYLDSKGQVRLTERGVDMGIVYNSNGESLNLRNGQGMWVSYADAEYTLTGDAANGITINQAGELLDITLNGVKIQETVRSLDELMAAINNRYNDTGVLASVVGNQLQLRNQNNVGTDIQHKNIKLTTNAGNKVALRGKDANGDPNPVEANIITAYQYTYSSVKNATRHDDDDRIARAFTTTEDLRDAMQEDARNHVNYKGNNNVVVNAGVEIIVNQQGQFEISNPRTANGQDMNITITGLSKNEVNNVVNVNSRLVDSFNGISGLLNNGSATNRASSALKMSTHSMSTEFYDSLGSKHEITVEYRKIGYDPENGTTWSVLITVPEPGVIEPRTQDSYKNVITGTIKFNNDGSLRGDGSIPKTINFTANNGSEAGQRIELNFGSQSGFDGMTAYDAKSSTENISQDGYPGGTLNDLRIDESGRIIGAFTNGHSLALAQVAMAAFTNNNGLESLGGNVYGETANSGGPVIGAAATGSRGKINSSTLEMSNVDLSRAFTQLIVIQRGYQANSKTITTSDNMLNTLLQLKQ